MAWNEPGNNGNDNGNDPWGGGRKGGGDQGPPDIDEVIKNVTKKFNSLFGGFGGFVDPVLTLVARKRPVEASTEDSLLLS